jgi:hypothetical protein
MYNKLSYFKSILTVMRYIFCAPYSQCCENVKSNVSWWHSSSVFRSRALTAFKSFKNNANQEEVKLKSTEFQAFQNTTNDFYIWYDVSLWNNTEVTE